MGGGLLSCKSSHDRDGLNILEDQYGIIGGSEVATMDSISKFVVKIHVYSLKKIGDPKPDNFYLCTGIIIDEYHILTAGHCVYREEPGEIKTGNTNSTVAEGAKAKEILAAEVYFNNSNVTEASSKTNKIFAKSVSVHPNYSFYRLRFFDLAVLELFEKIPSTALPIEFLPYSIELKEGDQLTVLGYGSKVDYGISSSSTLAKAENIPIQSDEGTNFLLDQKNGKGICSGDSGGPAVYLYQGKYYLVGINQGVVVLNKNSDSKGTCKSASSVVKAQTFKSWILKQISN